MTRSRWIWLVAAIASLAVSALVAPSFFERSTRGANPTERYLTQAVDRGDIVRTVSASGALNPVNLVQVGTQVSGTIRALHADFNSNVTAGQLLAQIDPAMLDAELAQIQAQRRSAQSSVDLARIKLARSKTLFDQGFVSRAEVDDAQASMASAQAALEQYEAGERRARTNRRYAEIRSPVNGTVVSREISVGQTVAASLQTPVLFRIAQDLREMQIETNVSEADVGLMREGQKVTFTVDAYPERVYQGAMHQIRNNYTVQQNVVTYTVVVRARNDDLSLRPGMTGYVSVTVGEALSVVRVPNAALRYEPAGAVPVPSGGPANRRQLWRLNAKGQAQAVEVVLGLSDGRYAERVSGDIKEGDLLIIGEKVSGGFAGPKIF
jgi:HlyD family secretion protein